MFPCLTSLLERVPAAGGRYATAWLQQRGVEVLLGQCIVDADWQEVRCAGTQCICVSLGT